MTISSKCRYALRVLIDLAENDNGSYTHMKVVAERQGISLKYLEHILPVLKQNGIVEKIHGKGDGYHLTRKPEKYTIGEILRLVEGDLAPVSCPECGAEPCERAEQCRTISMWKNLQNMIDGYFDGITLKDLMHDASNNMSEHDISLLDVAL